MTFLQPQLKTIADTEAAAPALHSSSRKQAFEKRDWLIAERFHRLSNASYISVRVLSFVLHRSVASLWRDVAAGRLPQPVKLGPNCTRFLVSSIREALHSSQMQSDDGRATPISEYSSTKNKLASHPSDMTEGVIDHPRTPTIRQTVCSNTNAPCVADSLPGEE